VLNPGWTMTQSSQILQSLDNQVPPNITITTGGCGLYQVCTQPQTTTTETCEITQDYQTATCTDYYTTPPVCSNVTNPGSGSYLVDNNWYIRLVLMPDGTYTLVGIDTGPLHRFMENQGAQEIRRDVGKRPEIAAYRCPHATCNDNSLHHLTSSLQEARERVAERS